MQPAEWLRLPRDCGGEMRQMATKKILASVETYDSNDITSTGYDVDIREDGTVRAEDRSCWQGSRSGRTYIGKATTELMATARGEGDADSPDIETAVKDWLIGHLEECRVIRQGVIIR
jgi:hypothetical protein